MRTAGRWYVFNHSANKQDFTFFASLSVASERDRDPSASKSRVFRTFFSQRNETNCKRTKEIVNGENETFACIIQCRSASDEKHVRRHSGHSHDHYWWSGGSHDSGLSIDPAPIVTDTTTTTPVEQPPAPIVVAPTDPAPIVQTPIDTAPVVQAPTDPAPTAPPATTVTNPPPPLDSTPSTTNSSLIRHDGPIHLDHAGQIIENIDIYVSSGDAITVTDDNVITACPHPSCRWRRRQHPGRKSRSAVEFRDHQFVSALRHQSRDERNIVMFSLKIHPNSKVMTSPCATEPADSIFSNSPSATLTSVDGYNFHGPEPRGQFIQLDKSGSATIDNFYVHDDPNNSHVEDNISVYSSPNVTIKNGVIDGNNSQTGVGVMFENGSTGGLVDHVDTIHMGNGSFRPTHPAMSSTMWAPSTIGAAWDRAAPSFAADLHLSADNLRFEGATYTHPYDPGHRMEHLARCGSRHP